MKKEVKSHFGKWKISGSNIELNGFLEIDHKAKIYRLKLYSEESVELPYFTDLIVGKTFKGNSFALIDCSLDQSVSTSYIHDYNRRYEIIVQCRYILEDCLIEKGEILITRLDFKLSNMDIWAHKDPIDVEFDKEKGYTIIAKQLNNISGKHKDFLISVGYDVMPDFKTRDSHEFKIIINCNFIIEFDSPVLLDRALNIIYQVRDFLTLCTTNRTYIENIYATPSMPVKNLEIYMPFKIYGPGIEKGDLNDFPQLRFIDINLSLDKIGSNFEKVFQNWFMKNEKLKPVIDLYIGIYYQRTSYERHFLNAVQALEAYHRLTRKNEVLPKSEHKLKIESILSSTQDEHKVWLRGKLNFSNEPSLHERLEDLFRPIKDPQNINYGMAYNLFRFHNTKIEGLIRDIKNTRNYNTHFDEKLKKKAVKGEDLIQLTNLLIIMIEYYLMTELELNEEMIIKIAKEKVVKNSQHRSYMDAIRNTNMN
ncbi:HEPN domain-containing protein [Peribacillus frigoritolerans]|uniref:HEPN domain-containing protein n=1 Tax=Peribacillus frigoritolerans TaxID=450367 RepID=UPI003CFEB201